MMTVLKHLAPIGDTIVAGDFLVSGNTPQEAIERLGVKPGDRFVLDAVSVSPWHEGNFEATVVLRREP